MENTYRVEFKRSGHSWRMDDQNHPNMTPTRFLSIEDAHRSLDKIAKETPSLALRIVKEAR